MLRQHMGIIMSRQVPDKFLTMLTSGSLSQHFKPRQNSPPPCPLLEVRSEAEPRKEQLLGATRVCCNASERTNCRAVPAGAASGLGNFVRSSRASPPTSSFAGRPQRSWAAVVPHTTAQGAAVSQHPEAAQVLVDFVPTKNYFVGIDSDGCAMDAMDIKHQECFTPCYIKHWDLQPVSTLARQTALFVNLGSVTRGLNRWLALSQVLNLLRDRVEVAERNVQIPEYPELAEFLAAPRLPAQRQGHRRLPCRSSVRDHCPRDPLGRCGERVHRRHGARCGAVPRRPRSDRRDAGRDRHHRRLGHPAARFGV